jgi:hypothetical protein
MRTYYIVKEKNILGDLWYVAYASKLDFFLHIRAHDVASYGSADDCISELKKKLKNKNFKRVIVTTVDL